LVERNLAKVEVESSRLFSRSRFREGLLLMLGWHITGQLNSSSLPSGEVAKRLCSGLQSRVDGFDSRPRLHPIFISPLSLKPSQGNTPFALRVLAGPLRSFVMLLCCWDCALLREARFMMSQVQDGELLPFLMARRCQRNLWRFIAYHGLLEGEPQSMRDNRLP
jgi:hypothetical protein